MPWYTTADARRDAERQSREADCDDDLDGLEIYVCQCCGHEDHPDRFGKYCPRCGTDLDELEAEEPPNRS